MDTLSFFKTILPPEGVYYLGVLQKGRHGVAHMPYTSLETMAAAVEKYDRHPDITVYHACGAYKEPFILGPDKVDPSREKRYYRVTENTLSAKALWIDLDCGEEKVAKGQGYIDKNTAAKAVIKFCQDTGFPTPMFVDSGNGVHAYWPFTEAVAADEWRPLATTFKTVLAHFKVFADPTRTADFASILRPVGSRNKKDQDNPKLVRTRSTVAPVEPAVIMAALSNIVSNHDVNCEPVTKGGNFLDSLPDVVGDVSINDDLAIHGYADVPVDAHAIAEKCQQVAIVRDSGSGSYEQWRRVIGILKFCEDGETVAHAWSAQDASYDKYETQQKIITWNTGPTTCDALAQCNPSGCDNCEFKGKIKTPLVLGRGEVVQEAQTMEAQVDGKDVEVDLPAPPHGYLFDTSKQIMYRQVKDKDGIVQTFEFCRLLFYPTTRICQQNGTFLTRIRAHMPDKAVRDFDIEAGVISSPQELLRVLGQYEIFASTSNKDANMHLHAYMRDSLHRLLQTSKEMNTMTTFGWKNSMDSFLIGDRLYNKDGSVRRVILGGYAAEMAKAFPEPHGSLQGWAEGVDFMYNRPMMEPMQYAICSGFGSILSPLGEDSYHGIPVALTGSESGRGKTTACKAALYAFGNAIDLMVNGKDGATVNARWAKMSAMNNIPILFDEMTNAKPAELSSLLYGASNGKDKERLQGGKNGVGMAAQQTWDMSIYITANNPIGALLASEKGNTEAEAMRFIEIKTDTYAIPELDEAQVGVAVKKITRNVGYAGEAFVKYVVSNLDEVTELFVKTSDRLNFASGTASHQKYRYYRNHAICTLTALQIMHKLDIAKFDMESLFAWTFQHIEFMCKEAAENNTMTEQEAINSMISDLSPYIITTAMYRDGRNGSQVDNVPKMHKAPVGRHILGTSDKSEPLAGKLFLSKGAVKQWCLDNRIDPNRLIKWLESEGLISHRQNDQFSIGKGTDSTAGTLRCYCIEMAKMHDLLTGAPRLVHSTTEQEDKAA